MSSPTPNGKRILVVGVADGLASARTDCEIVTYALGSCVAVTLYDGVSRCGGMAHLMLPAAMDVPGVATKGRFTFVHLGLALLETELLRLGASTRRLQAWVVGGAAMTPSDLRQSIGDQNVADAYRVLRAAGIAIVGRRTGGAAPRQVKLSVATGAVSVRDSVPKVGSPTEIVR